MDYEHVFALICEPSISFYIQAVCSVTPAVQMHACVSQKHIDTTVVGLISSNDEANHSSEVSQLSPWCKDNNFFLNKLVETSPSPSATIDGPAVEQMNMTKFLGGLGTG